jgi:hypothetical protein
MDQKYIPHFFVYQDFSYTQITKKRTKAKC